MTGDEPDWRVARRCNGGACVKVAAGRSKGTVRFADSKLGDNSPVLEFGSSLLTDLAALDLDELLGDR